MKSRIRFEAKKTSSSPWKAVDDLNFERCSNMKLGPDKEYFAVRMVNTKLGKVVYMRDDMLAYHYSRSRDELVCTSPKITRVSIADDEEVRTNDVPTK